MRNLVSGDETSDYLESRNLHFDKDFQATKHFCLHPATENFWMAPAEGNLGVRIGQPAWQNLYGILAWVGWPLIGVATAGPVGPVRKTLLCCMLAD